MKNRILSGYWKVNILMIYVFSISTLSAQENSSAEILVKDLTSYAPDSLLNLEASDIQYKFESKIIRDKNAQSELKN